MSVRDQALAAHAWQASARQTFTTWRPGGLAAEIMVEADDAMDLGARQVQRVGDQRHGGRIHIAELLLQRVQDRQQRARHVLPLGDQRLRRARVPMAIAVHLCPLIS